jgi:hypothetical protein
MTYLAIPDFALPLYSIPDFSIQMFGDGGEEGPGGTGGNYYFMLMAYGII